MRRRELLLASFGVRALAQEQPREWVTAVASRDTAPRVGLIPSSFTGGEEMDGRKIRALTKPAPVTTALTVSQLGDMLRLAVELGGGRRGGLSTAIQRDDWVVIKIRAHQCQGGAFHAGAVTDPRLVAEVLRYLVQRKLGRRFSIVGRGCQTGESLWDSTWGGAFDGVSYRSIVQGISKQQAGLRLELVDLQDAPALRMPVEGRVFSKRNPEGMYSVPRLVRECDKVISMVPLATRAGAGVDLSMMNYLDFDPVAPGEEADEVAVDLFSFHPADYAIVGGAFAAESDGSAGGGTRLRRHNVMIAGNNAPAVDAVAAAVMGLDSTTIRHLELAVRRGYGGNDASSIWTRGAEIDEVKAAFPRHG